jgi:hypothetical protein
VEEVVHLRRLDRKNPYLAQLQPPKCAGLHVPQNGRARHERLYFGYLAGSFFKFDPDIRFHSQFTLGAKRRGQPAGQSRRVVCRAWI